ncbi:hypothetical protein BCR41DRAFT_355793 [Lobosporangium transversale]|uniref:Uncharacterized protein n=1 Tax=Lobosporangium transversale TaxID=64571 RepID=A0A1Y2GK98_9FUNG|nr:hypothetical protein BCR41DRAFT_355793 [Lobosporangium transversale]ORZ13450.1 hypothetical protein BCR41DRAFT_355793 [Lobosporangium transversale]|eukprot:XP_021880531.1 hypothetical protein BCR41DRAFT_355793 [Lobosporangium transversale]
MVILDSPLLPLFHQSIHQEQRGQHQQQQQQQQYRSLISPWMMPIAGGVNGALMSSQLPSSSITTNAFIPCCQVYGSTSPMPFLQCMVHSCVDSISATDTMFNTDGAMNLAQRTVVNEGTREAKEDVGERNRYLSPHSKSERRRTRRSLNQGSSIKSSSPSSSITSSSSPTPSWVPHPSYIASSLLALPTNTISYSSAQPILSPPSSYLSSSTCSSSLPFLPSSTIHKTTTVQSTPISNTTIRKPFPPKFYIMEPYKHSTAKIDRRSFNSRKELKQAQARELYSNQVSY